MRVCHAVCSPSQVRTSPPAANAPPLRAVERQSQFQPPSQFNVPPLRAVQYASPIPTSACSQRASPANKYWWCVKDAGLSRCLLRSSQFQRPTAPRHRMPVPKTNAASTPAVPKHKYGSLRSIVSMRAPIQVSPIGRQCRARCCRSCHTQRGVQWLRQRPLVFECPSRFPRRAPPLFVGTGPPAQVYSGVFPGGPLTTCARVWRLFFSNAGLAVQPLVLSNVPRARRSAPGQL